MKPFLFSLFSLAASIPSFGQDSLATVYFYRPAKGADVTTPFEIYRVTERIGQITAGSILTYRCSPGRIWFHAKTRNENSYNLELEPSGTYYVECTISTGAVGRAYFRQVYAEEAREALRKINPNAAELVKDDGMIVSQHPQQTELGQDQKTEFGFKTGMNISVFSASINSESSPKTGFHFGMYLRVPLSAGFFFRPEVYYSSQGQKDNYKIPTSGISRGTTTTTIDYLNVPVLFESGSTVTIHFGPQLGILLSGREQGTFDGQKVDNDLKGLMKSPDISAVFGFGINPGKHLRLGARYHLGLTPMFKKPFSAPPDYPEVKNRVIHAFVAFSF